MPSFCCSECFNDRGLKVSIIPALEPGRGRCNYCDTDDVDLVEPQALAPYFELLLSSYEQDSDGKPLVELLREDWDLFPADRMDSNAARVLLGDILDDGQLVRQSFVPSAKYRSDGLGRWDSLRDEIMYANRWFVDSQVDMGRLEELLVHLPADGLPESWYRARIWTNGDPYLIENMWAPPKRLAGNGRANPAGIPYLYLGSEPNTAVAEIRPHTGQSAYVAGFTVPELRAIDLRSPRQLVSPFILSEPADIGQLRADIPFLERLGEELTRPVLPSSAAIDYIPSQYLCEFIKKCGYHGVVYRSSVSDGFNLALFDPCVATGGEVNKYLVEQVTVSIVGS